MDDPKIIQTIVPTRCPYCQKEIFINYQLVTPTNIDVTTREAITAAKEDLKKKLDEIVFTNPEEKNGIILWINDDTTLITQNDVEAIIMKIVENQTK